MVKTRGDNVVFLNFKSPNLQDDTLAFLSCVACKNKSFVFMSDEQEAALVKCCACGAHIGRMGWYHDNDPVLGGKSA